MKIPRSAIATGTLMLLAVRVLPAQRAVPTITLDKGAVELTETFTTPGRLAELRNGQVLIDDVGEKTLWLVDFVKDSRIKAARSGAGPTEIQLGMMLPGAADSALFFDMVQRRVLLFAPDGKAVRTIPIMSEKADMTAILSAFQPSATDAAGRMYGQGTGMRMATPDAAGDLSKMMPKFDDTVAVVRFDFRTGRTDTVARIRNLISQSAPKMEVVGSVMKLSMRAPDMRPTDQWTVLPDGRTAILRDGDYRVRFATPGKPLTVGPLVPHTLIRVTAAEKKALVDSVRSAMAKAMAGANRMAAGAASSASGGTPAMPKFEFDVLEPPSWADTKPPYGGLMASPGGLIWVYTPEPAGSKISTYDVLDGTGALVARVRTVPGEALVGLGRGTAYTRRIDADDLVYLRRYSLPAPIGR